MHTGHKKQILLFLLTILLPSMGLIFLTLRMVTQDKELAMRRSAEARLLAARRIGDELFTRLEAVKAGESGNIRQTLDRAEPIYPSNPVVEFICPVIDGHLLLPWEIEHSTPFSNKNIQAAYVKAERVEFAEKNYPRARQQYAELLQQPLDDSEKNTIRLSYARTLAKSSQEQAAEIQYKTILKLPFTVMDENGIPLSLYAARQLIGLKAADAGVTVHLHSQLSSLDRLSLSAVLMLRNILSDISDAPSDTASRTLLEHCEKITGAYIRKKELMIQLQRDYTGLGLEPGSQYRSNRDNQAWLVYGNGAWLISRFTPGPQLAPLLMAVSIDQLLTTIRTDSLAAANPVFDFQFTEADSREGFSLGPAFPNVKLAYGDAGDRFFAEKWRIQPVYYLLALLLVLGVMFSGASLLWRDVQREMQIADMRSQFVSSVSHELKTPLTSIRMFAETMRMGRLKSKDMQNEFLDTIVNESQRLTRLLNNVLDFSKIEKGKGQYRFTKAPLENIIRSACKAMAYPLSRQGFRLHTEIDDTLPSVKADPDALEQALLNLLHNAMKYSGDSRDIHLTVKADDHWSTIKVKDFGIGISEKDITHIQEKFYRVSSPENERIVGTGLGLTLVSHIIESHGGHLSVESSLGKGSTFTIHLPLEGP